MGGPESLSKQEVKEVGDGKISEKEQKGINELKNFLDTKKQNNDSVQFEKNRGELSNMIKDKFSVDVKEKKDVRKFYDSLVVDIAYQYFYGAGPTENKEGSKDQPKQVDDKKLLDNFLTVIQLSKPVTPGSKQDKYENMKGKYGEIEKSLQEELRLIRSDENRFTEILPPQITRHEEITQKEGNIAIPKQTFYESDISTGNENTSNLIKEGEIQDNVKQLEVQLKGLNEKIKLGKVVPGSVEIHASGSASNIPYKGEFGDNKGLAKARSEKMQEEIQKRLSPEYKDLKIVSDSKVDGPARDASKDTPEYRKQFQDHQYSQISVSYKEIDKTTTETGKPNKLINLLENVPRSTTEFVVNTGDKQIDGKKGLFLLHVSDKINKFNRAPITQTTYDLKLQNRPSNTSHSMEQKNGEMVSTTPIFELQAKDIDRINKDLIQPKNNGTLTNKDQQKYIKENFSNTNN